MNEKVMSSTLNLDGQTVVVIADTVAALTTHINLKKLDKKKGFNGA